ncbi:beta-galactosidase [Pelagicoccus sp. SDUM812005]|uniref:beta-galactosidase n=1 Tax=Pelagicoccus sp. SDUM812005 TaxID=3041257 RepID=UPI00281053F5|nr:beta-galactosidase [Pelagicoccus sp. SDUM812005]MDQ8181676.1 beta-galactosidase [Pelagicoccus sp. SDUM812005]
MIIPKLSGKIIFGCDYNPEQWPETIWQEDMRLMQRCGVNLVSVGIFSWAKLQPSADTWNFDWLDRVMDLLAEHEIFACLATATASPPAWLTKQHPEILPLTRDGKTLFPGSRQHYSPSSSAYRKAAATLVEKIAERYQDHPALAVWHINNEYACHMQECYGEESTQRFRLWLKNKYKTLDSLNEAWGTAFWSQIFGDWDEVHPPREAPYFSNPTQQLDFKRFTSDAFLDLFLMEKEILRKRTPEIPITTNFMGFFKPLDYHRWAKEVDFTAWDSYPDPIDEKAARQTHAAGNDLTRSLKPDQPFVLMEQASSAVNWRDINLPKRPGLMRLISLQTVARGGDGVMYFQWRASKAGTEKYHSAIVQHVGAENSRVFREVEKLGAELKQLAPVSDSRVQAEVAIVFDWHTWWSLEVDSRPSKIDYPAGANQIHDWFYRQNIAVDFVSPDADLARYKLVVTPSLYIVDDACAASLKAFVEQGGTLLATYFSGIVDENDHAQLGGYPAKLRDLLGLWVEEWHPYSTGQGNRIRSFDGNSSYDCELWADIAHLDGAEPLASFEEGFFKGGPAYTKNDYGKGAAYYLGTRLKSEGLDWVLRNICYQSAGIEPALTLPEGVESAIRTNENGEFLFLLNHTDAAQTIDLSARSGVNLASGEHLSGTIEIPPLDVFVIQLQ